MTCPRVGRLLGTGLLAIALSLGPTLLSAQDIPGKGQAAAAVNLVFLGDTQPVLLRLNVSIDGKSVPAFWNDYIRQWFQYLDVDNDGFLNGAEVQHAPRDQAMLQLMRQGNFFPSPNTSLKLADLNKKEGDKVTLAEFQTYYRRLVGPVQIIPQTNQGTFFGEASNSLFKALDLNKDGRLSKEELLAASTTLRKFDLDDDEWITAQELAPTAANALGLAGFVQGGGVPAGGQISAAFFHLQPGENRLPLLLLARYDRDNSKKLSRMEIGLDEITFAKLDANQDGELDVEELARWHERAADLEFTIRLGKTAATGLELQGKVKTPFTQAAKETGPGTYQMTFGDAQIQLALTADSPRAVGRFNQGQFIIQQFRLADTKKKGYLEIPDLQNQPNQFLRQLFPIVDRDRDGKMTEKELQTFFDLQSQAMDCFVTLSLADQGRALFQLLDANRDGRLSPREMLTAWNRIAHLDRTGTGSVAATDIARQFQITVQKGQANFGVVPVGFIQDRTFSPRPGAGQGAPDWFRRMDKNGDGDVSFREFLGSREDFQRIDTDGDGLINAEEASRYEAQVRAKQK